MSESRTIRFPDSNDPSLVVMERRDIVIILVKTGTIWTARNVLRLGDILLTADTFWRLSEMVAQVYPADYRTLYVKSGDRF